MAHSSLSCLSVKSPLLFWEWFRVSRWVKVIIVPNDPLLRLICTYRTLNKQSRGNGEVVQMHLIGAQTDHLPLFADIK